MKSAIILFSLIVNIALAVAVVQRQRAAGSTLTLPATQPPPKANDIVATSKAWAHLTQSKEDIDFVAGLRSSGFPVNIIRTLVQLRLRERFAEQLLALEKKDNEIPYWRTEPWAYDFNPETRAKRRAIEREIADQVKSLLGADALESDYARGERIRSFGNIPRAKIEAVQAIQKDYSELTGQIREASKGVVLADDREKLAYLEKERRADLVQLLTPDELAEYDKRNSPAAGTVRNRLRYFDASEEEFLKLYQLQRDFDEHFGNNNLSGAQADRRNAALPELSAQIEGTLGQQRYAEYQIVTDGNYYNTRSFATSVNIPADTAKDLVRLQRDLIRQAETIRSDNSLTTEQRSAQLTSLEGSAQEKLSVTMGADNLAYYRKVSAGQWLTKLSPSQKKTTPR